MNAEKIKELREIAHRDSAVSLTVRAADLRALLDEVEALRGAAEELLGVSCVIGQSHPLKIAKAVRRMEEALASRHEPKELP